MPRASNRHALTFQISGRDRGGRNSVHKRRGRFPGGSAQIQIAGIGGRANNGASTGTNGRAKSGLPAAAPIAAPPAAPIKAPLTARSPGLVPQPASVSAAANPTISKCVRMVWLLFSLERQRTMVGQRSRPVAT